MVQGDHAPGRMVQRGDSGGRIAVTNLGEMMSLDPYCVCVFVVSVWKCTSSRLITSGMSGWGYDCICIDDRGVEVARNAMANQSQSSRLASLRRVLTTEPVISLI